MKFSILTCSYNNREGVLASMEAVRGQRSEGVEIEHIVIDGGSADGTVEALRSESLVHEASSRAVHGPGSGDSPEDSRSPQNPETTSSGSETATAEASQMKPRKRGTPNVFYTLKWLSEPDRGLYDALNKGLRMATGDVIGILHTDDVWEEGVLKRVRDAFEERSDVRIQRSGGSNSEFLPSDFSPLTAHRPEGIYDSTTQPPNHSTNAEGVYGDLLYVDADDITKVRRVWRSGAYDAKKFDRGWMPPHPALFVRRELAERVGEYRLDLGSAADYEWMLRACRVHHARLAHLPAVLVRMRVGGLSNASVKARLKANRNDRHAWELNGLTPRPWTLFLKPVRKLPQWMAARRGRGIG